MRIRALDTSGDWTFGSGQQNYLTDQNAVQLDIQTRLSMFQGDCFFDADGWIDWFNLLGSKNEAQLVFSIRAIIAETSGVNNVTDVSTTLDENRNLATSWEATTIYGEPVGGDNIFPVTPFPGISKFVGEVIFSGSTTVDVDTSGSIADARDAVWILYDEGDDFSPVVGAAQPISATTVRLTISPAPTGNFRLVGIA